MVNMKQYVAKVLDLI